MDGRPGPLRERPGQDPPSSGHRHVRAASATPADGTRAGARDRPASLHDRVALERRDLDRPASPPSGEDGRGGGEARPGSNVPIEFNVPPQSRDGARPMTFQTQLRIPGPTPLPERVVRSMNRPMIDHRGPAFAAILAEPTAVAHRGLTTANDPLRPSYP